MLGGGGSKFNGLDIKRIYFGLVSLWSLFSTLIMTAGRKEIGCATTVRYFNAFVEYIITGDNKLLKQAVDIASLKKIQLQVLIFTN